MAGLISNGTYVLGDPNTRDLYLGKGLKQGVEGDKWYIAADETVLWEGEPISYTGDNKGAVDGTLSESVSNFEIIAFYLNIAGEDTAAAWLGVNQVIYVPVINNVAGYFYSIPETSYSGNWYKWFGLATGNTFSSNAGFASAANAHNKTLNGGLWKKGALYKIVGINRKEQA